MKTILVVDDNREILDTLSATLARHLRGCSIMTASDGARGQEILRSMPIALVLTDLGMPRVNGYMLIEHTKKNFPHIPVCVMTANCSAQVINKLRVLGVGRWIEKPFQFDSLTRMIAEELNIAYND
jgi:two-component system NtrC family response regulator